MATELLCNPVSIPEGSLEGINAIVTGATSGIGLAVCEEMARKGARVTFAIRNSKKAEKVKQQIISRVPPAVIVIPPQVPVIDMMEPDSIANFCSHINATDERLHVLVNNAGMSRMDHFHTGRGVASLAQANFLGTYQLNRLLERKMVADKTRVVFVSSFSSRTCIIQDPHLFLTSWYHSWYKHTKLAEVLLAFEMQRRFGDQGLEVVSVDPGGVNTAIWTSTVFSSFPIKQILNQLYAPAEDAAQIVMHAAFVPWTVDAEPGVPPCEDLRFYARGMFASPLLTMLDGAWHTYIGTPRWALYASMALLHSFLDYPARHLSNNRLASKVVRVPANRQAYNRLLSKKLWELSAEYAGIQNLELLQEADIQPKRQVAPSPQVLVKGSAEQQQQQQRDTQPVQDKDVKPEAETVTPQPPPPKPTETKQPPPPPAVAEQKPQKTAEEPKQGNEPKGSESKSESQVSSQQQQQQQQQQQEQQQEQQHIVTARGFQSIEELQKLQEEIERATHTRDDTLVTHKSALLYPENVPHPSSPNAPCTIEEVLGISSTAISPILLSNTEAGPCIISQALPTTKAEALANMDTLEGPTPPDHVQRAAVALADKGALPALKATAELLAESSVQEPLAAIAAAIITLGADGSFAENVRMVAREAAKKPRADRLLVETASLCLFVSSAAAPIEGSLKELHATEVHPCAHADVAAAVLACTPHIPMMDATGRFPFPPTFPSGVEEWATEFLLEQQPGNAAAAAPAGPAISKASSPIQQEGQKKILSGGVPGPLSQPPPPAAVPEEKQPAAPHPPAMARGAPAKKKGGAKRK